MWRTRKDFVINILLLCFCSLFTIAIGVCGVFAFVFSKDINNLIAMIFMILLLTISIIVIAFQIIAWIVFIRTIVKIRKHKSKYFYK